MGDGFADNAGVEARKLALEVIATLVNVKKIAADRLLRPAGIALVIWPCERPVHTLRRILYCAKCLKRSEKKRRPDLIGLQVRVELEPTSPAAAIR